MFLIRHEGSSPQRMFVCGNLRESHQNSSSPYLAENAFHVVGRLLPGFGYSGKPNEKGWSSQRMAEVIAKLMARLGDEHYGIQGGDWGGGSTCKWGYSSDTEPPHSSNSARGRPDWRMMDPSVPRRSSQ